VPQAHLSTSPPLPPLVYLHRPLSRLPFPLGEGDCVLYSRARRALWHGIRTLGLRPRDEILVPTYHCGSEIEALIEADLSLRWYEPDEHLEPIESELEILLGPSVRALLLIHYLGFPQNSERWRSWCDAHGLLLIEDAAQALLASIDGRPAGSFGDLAVFSLYKTYGVPDGGAALCRCVLEKPAAPAGLGLWLLLRRHAAWIAMRSRLAGAATASLMPHRLAGTPPYDPDASSSLGPDTAPLRSTLALLSRVCDPGAAEQRRANYRYLLEKLAPLVPPPFDRLPEGASPYMFPIKVERKDAFLHRLRSYGIQAINFWSVPHRTCPAERFPTSQERRTTTVALPVHQELTSSGLRTVADATRRSLTLTEVS
jgi:dTDP-4-amino-4,6-dideoxygalactose transaminase